jgi:hypothetical protein
MAPARSFHLSFYGSKHGGGKYCGKCGDEYSSGKCGDKYGKYGDEGLGVRCRRWNGTPEVLPPLILWFGAHKYGGKNKKK